MSQDWHSYVNGSTRTRQGPRMPDGAYYDSHPQHQQQHQSAYEDGGTERSSGLRQAKLASLDFGTNWQLPGLGPGEPRDRSSNAVDGIFDLYAQDPPPPPQPTSRPAMSIQTTTPSSSSQQPHPPYQRSTSSESSINSMPRRSPNGPRPLPSKPGTSARSVSSPFSSSTSSRSDPVPEEPHTPPWTQRPRPAFSPVVGPPSNSMHSFDSARSSTDHSVDTGSDHSHSTTRSYRRGGHVDAASLPTEHLPALRELNTAAPPKQPSIVKTPPLPPKDNKTLWTEQTAGSTLSPSRSTRGGHLSPQSSLTANAWLHRNASTGTTTSLAQTEDEVERHYNQALLSNMATYLKERVPRAEHVRGAIPYPMAFTGRDIVSTLERALSDNFKSRKVALQIAKSLHSQLLFFEVRDNDRPVQDGLDQVFVFPEDDGGGATWDELPSGVFVETTGCYSPLCTSLTAQGVFLGGCLSPSCPNNLASLKREPSVSSEAETPTKTPHEESAWAETVEPELLHILGKKEVERQNQIHELIVGEATYVRDIELLRSEFLEPLTEADPPIIPQDAQSNFFADVLCNAFEIKDQAQAFSEALTQRQREQGPVIQNIGDVVINAAVDWGLAYVNYAKAYPFADARIKAEKAKNPLFDQFLTAFTRRPATRKLAVHSYQTRITIRLQRYILLLKGILKSTPEDNDDRFALMQAIEIIDQQCKQSDAAVASSEAILECRRYHRELLVQGFQSKWLSELDLLDDHRRLVKKSKMYRRSENATLSDFSKLDLVLFDNFICLTNHSNSEKSSKSDKPERLVLLRRPMPLQLVSAEGFDDPPVPRSSRLGLRSLNADGGTAQSTKDHRMLYPIQFILLGRAAGTITLFAESAQSRQEWREALFEATEQRNQVMAQSSVFRVSIANSGNFLPRTRTAPQPTGKPVAYGRPTCSVSWTTSEGHRLLAVGHDEGLWIGIPSEPESFRCVVPVRYITQCAILQEYGIFLILTDKMLVAYSLEALVPQSSKSLSSTRDRETKEPQKISGQKEVLFFKVGRIGSRLLVIYVKKDGVTQTVFKALEPIPIAERATKGFMRRRTELFKEYKEFFVPSDCFGLLFLRSQLSIICAKGFELMAIDKEPLRSISFPDWSQLKSDTRAVDLQKRCDNSRSVAMFRISDSEFLFVFEDLAFYADKHGDPIPRRYDDVIEWFGRARSVVYLPPYVAAFDENFIEIRHASTGKLVQLVKGKNIACTHDGQYSGSEGTSDPGGASSKAQVTMRLPDVVTGRDTFVIGELVRV